MFCKASDYERLTVLFEAALPYKPGICPAFTACSEAKLRLSPALIDSLSAHPAGSSSTLFARGTIGIILQGLRFLAIFTTVCLESKKTASIGNFTKKVCIPLHGKIRRPVSGGVWVHIQPLSR